MFPITKKALVGFILLGLMTYWGASWKIRTSTKPLDIPYQVLTAKAGIPLTLTILIEVFTLVFYLLLKKYEPWINQQFEDLAKSQYDMDHPEISRDGEGADEE